VLLAFVSLMAVTSAESAERQTLKGHVPVAAARLQPVGRLSASRSLELAIGLPLRNREALANLLQQIYDPASPNYHHYLTAEEFAEQFGPTEKDYQAAAGFAKANCLTVTGTHPNRTLLDVSGTVAQIESAFHIKLRVYEHPTESRTFHAPDTEPSLDLAVPVLGISGLDDFVRPRPMSLRADAFGTPHATAWATGSSARGQFIGQDFRAAYAPGVSLNGAGQAVGLFEMDGYFPNDITTYENVAGLPNVPLVNVLVGSANGHAGANNVEVELDIDMAISMAPGLAKVIVYEGTIPNDILNRMATDNLARQLSSSWAFGSQTDAVREQIFQQFAAQGQSMFQASGDSGAYAGAIAPPSDDPWLTIVGGTSLTTTGPGGNWSSETVWFGSGGGISTVYPIPLWQQGLNMSANQGSTTMRNIPDVAAIAESVIWLVANNGQQGVIGGTSASAPLWAGFAALANQQAAADGRPAAGFINPAIYAIGQSPPYPASLHDVVVGSNTNKNSTNKFFAVSGYDLCTGWGTPTGSNLIQALLGPPNPLQITPPMNLTAIGPPGGPFNLSAQNYTLTNLGVVPFNWSLVNTAGWLNASSSAGTLAPGGPATPLSLFLNPTAASLPPGNYNTIIWLTNLNDGFAQSRQFSLAVISESAPGVSIATLYSFSGGNDGGNPNGLAQRADGTFYGTAQNGGANDMGTIFQLNGDGTPASQYSFTGLNDGGKPFSVLLQGADGDLYGTTYQGGASNLGTVFRTDGNGTIATLHSFGFPDGVLPYGKLVQGPDGNFFGTAYQAQASTYGTVYKLTPAGTFSVVYTFLNGGDGAYPYAGLALGGDGSFYGTAYKGGAFGYGTIFRVTASGALTTLVSFNNTNGAFPYAGLTLGSDGMFYGATSGGGSFTNGTIFRVSPTGQFTSLYSFTGASDGRGPTAALIEGADGNFYGTTTYGGAYGNGTVFRITRGGALATLAQFDGFNGANPLAPLVQDTDNRFYGTTQNGGATGQGVIFRLTIAGSAPQITSQPISQTVFAGVDVTLSVSTAGGFPLFYRWQKNGSDLADGGNVSGSSTHALTLGSVTVTDTAHYSVTVSNAFGPVFSDEAMLDVVLSPPQFITQPTNLTLSPGTNAVFIATVIGDLPLYYRWQKNGTNLYDAGNLAGAASSALTIRNVTEADNGIYALTVSNALYSATSSNAVLTVVPVSAAGTRVTTLNWFYGGNDGRIPNGLVLGSNGDFYGTTQYGGTHLSGTIFRMNTTNGALTTLLSCDDTKGYMPLAALIQGVDGNFYGTMSRGGSFGAGTVFRMNPAGAYTNLYSFTGASDGLNPSGALVQAHDGNFYGTTVAGGTAGYGNIFKMTPAGVLTSLYSFTNGADGSFPDSTLVQGTDDNFYFMTRGGALGYGAVFKMTADGTLSTIYTFTNGTDGSYPVGALVQGSDGNFYGATRFNTIRGFVFYGTIFKITTDGLLTTLYPLNFTDGTHPYAGVIQGSDGNFYGTTYDGGSSGNGTVYRIAPNGSFFTLLNFNGFDDGAHPQSALVEGVDGSLYSTTATGGPGGQGTIFRVSMTGSPQITSPPVGQILLAGGNVTLSVAAFGKPPLYYHWRRNQTNLADSATTTGSTTRILTLSNVAPTNSGTYTVMVSNTVNSVTSPGAILTVIPIPLFQAVKRTNSIITLTWSAAAGQDYQLQYSTDLIGWNDLDIISATKTTATTTDDIGQDPQRFYRVILLQ